MQGGDLGSDVAARVVVVAEPMMVILPEQTWWQRFKTMRRIVGDEDRHFVRTGDWNTTVAAWMMEQSRRYGLVIDVWSFLPEQHATHVFDYIATLAPDVSSFTRWDSPEDAELSIRYDQSVQRVYDGDEERAKEYWGFRMHVVPHGYTP